MIRLSIAAAAIVFAMPALADNTITVNWHNETRNRISGSLVICNPRETCSYPEFGVGVGETQQVVQTVSPDTYMRWMEVGYSYWHEKGGLDGKGGFRGCKISISEEGPGATWPGPGCKEGKRPVIYYTDGYEPNPSCKIEVIKQKYDTCDFVYDVRMSATN